MDSGVPPPPRTWCSVFCVLLGDCPPEPLAGRPVPMITRIAISGYRSLRDVRLALGPVNAVTGANGSGKSSLYRALRLLADIAQGRIVASLAGEGGLSS